jgi:hypothetical protein
MIELFYNRIITGNKTFSEVKLEYQPAVHTMLISNGYTDLGTLIPVTS